MDEKKTFKTFAALKDYFASEENDELVTEILASVNDSQTVRELDKLAAKARKGGVYKYVAPKIARRDREIKGEVGPAVWINESVGMSVVVIRQYALLRGPGNRTMKISVFKLQRDGFVSPPRDIPYFTR